MYNLETGGNPMTSELKQAIDLAESLSIAEKRELIKTLSVSIQEAESLEYESDEDPNLGFSPERFRRSWEQAMTGQTLPLSALWEDDDVE
jgi:hypothetical protein